ncbi:MAG: DNA-directed RNA polymerase subunit A' [Candidatus Micrarchaeota archaeon]|nr:MAG: DNA-directed RNA polymerase subunit A' [Candidatus Micrarchaeota archaeon]
MKPEVIDYIRFSVMPDYLIKKISVAKISIPETYDDEGYPIDAGLADQRLGVVDPGLRCKTCGGNLKTCQGHFGHIELVRPVIHPFYAKVIYLLLQVTCYKCHRLLLDADQLKDVKEDLKGFLEEDITNEEELKDYMDSEKRLNEKRISSLVSKSIKRMSKCPYCGADIAKIKFERPTTFYIDNERLRPDVIKEWLSNISDEDLAVLGIDGKLLRPEWFIITNLLVPPVSVRPSIILENGERSEDDLTHQLAGIIRVNRKLQQDIESGAPQIIIDDQWELLQYHVSVYFDNELPGVPVSRHRSGRALKNLAQRLKGKEGRLRYNLSGKRVNYSARTVIVPDTSLNISELGVPKRIAQELTVPVNVTEWNIEALKELIRRREFPTAVYVISNDGIKRKVTDANREDIANGLTVGSVVERQLMDGDIVLFNRQPTLHRISIMAHRVRVLPGRVFRLNLPVTTPYNADFDGDEMNMHVPQSIPARAEALVLMQPKDCILSPRDGKPIMKLQEDIVIGLYLLTNDDRYFDKRDASYLLSLVGIFELPEPEKNGLYSGKAIFSMLLPKDFNYKEETKKGVIEIKNGKLIKGVISSENVRSGKSLFLAKLYDKYGSDFMDSFLQKATLLALAVTYRAGLTIGMKDYDLSEELIKEKDKIIKETLDEAEKIRQEYKEGRLIPEPGYKEKEYYTIKLLQILSKSTKRAEELLINKLNERENSPFLMARLDARGKLSNLVEMSLFLGQQMVRGKRTHRGYGDRLIPYLSKKDKTPRAHGFIVDSFMYGLDPIEMIMHAMGSRASMQAKSLVTAVSGYLQRRLINSMQDFYIEKDLSVRDSSGRLIQTVYGGDGIDGMYELVSKLE